MQPLPGVASAQDYPTRAVTIVVPFSPGGPGDLTARFIAQRLSSSLGQPFVVDNKPGANGVLAAVAAKNAPADGYTLLQISSSHTVNESLITKRGYELMRDFDPVAAINYTEMVHDGRTDGARERRVPEFIKLLKANPDKLQLRVVGQRVGVPHGRRALQDDGRRVDHARAVQERVDRAHRPRRRPGRDDVRRVAGGDRAGPRQTR